MDSTLKNYMNDQQIGAVADTVARAFEKTTGQKLTDCDREVVLMITEKTFDKYAVEIRDEILVAPGDKEKINSILDSLVSSLSNLMGQYIYSKLESYILFKRVKELENKDL